MDPADHDYVCASCGKRAPGRYYSGGWWQYPLGWLVHDGGERWTCSVFCARSVATSERSDPRRASGLRPRVDVEKKNVG
jgi:hypothetical protein